MTARAFHIRGILFDFDGTLTEPGACDWVGFRDRIGCPRHVGVLEYIASLSDAGRRRQLEADLERFEIQGADRSVQAAGSADLIAALRAKGLPMGILTRNSRRSVLRAMARFDGIWPEDFDLMVTRETEAPPKPSPDGILYAARHWQIAPQDLLVVGDFVFDIEAGLRAGAVTVLIDAAGGAASRRCEPDFVIASLLELLPVVRLGTPMAGGKLPNDLLADFFESLSDHAGEMLIRPGIGQDTAAVAVGEGVLVLKSDPITFVTDAIAEYAVIVNANDIATTGADPRWFLATLLFPAGSTPSQIRRVMDDLSAVCRRWDIVLCGGHTEVTDAVSRPVVSGMLCGTVDAGRLVDKRSMRSGDLILMTKQVAVEGTAIIAREFGSRLVRDGVDAETVAAAAGFLSRISILPEARIAAGFSGVSAMHDVTEGGLATAVAELAEAGGQRLQVSLDQIPVFSETALLCETLGIDPMGLIGSGSLLIACRPEHAQALSAALAAAGIQSACIGEALGAGRGVAAVKNGGPAPWPTFEADELTRLFQA